MMKQHGFTRPRVSFSLCLDISMFALVCVLMSVSLTGLPLLEWLGIALSPLVLLHVNWHAQWYLDQFRRMLTPCSYRARINFLLNIALLVLMAGLVVSGLFRSHQLSPIVREGIGRHQVWKNVHNWSSVAVISLVSLHLGLNWDWIMAAVRRHPRETSPSAKSPVSNVAPPPCQDFSFVNLLMKTLAVATITVIAAFAVYGPTAVSTFARFPLHNSNFALKSTALIGVVAQLVERLVRKQIQALRPIFPPSGLTRTNPDFASDLRFLKRTHRDSPDPEILTRPCKES